MMSGNDFDFLTDITESTSTRFVCFITESMKRFDLAITSTTHFYGKILVTDLQLLKSAIIGPDDLETEGYLEHVFELNEVEAQELRLFLDQVVGVVNFTDF